MHGCVRGLGVKFPFTYSALPLRSLREISRRVRKESRKGHKETEGYSNLKPKLNQPINQS